MISDSPTRLIIISILPEPIAAELRCLMDTFGDAAASRVAREYPPHVTLRTGALVPNAELKSYVDGFRDHLDPIRPFVLETEGFVHETYDAGGAKKHFFGYTVKKSPPLMGLHTHLLAYDRYIKQGASSFWPHLSIAYGDVTDEGARAVEKRLQSDPTVIPDSFFWECSGVSLYHRVDATWSELVTLPMNQLDDSNA